MRGFVGGQWSFALDGNDTNGVETGGEGGRDAFGETIGALQDDGDHGVMEHGFLNKEDRRLAVYCLGWESAEVSQRLEKPLDVPCPHFAG